MFQVLLLSWQRHDPPQTLVAMLRFAELLGAESSAQPVLFSGISGLLFFLLLIADALKKTFKGIFWDFPLEYWVDLTTWLLPC